MKITATSFNELYFTCIKQVQERLKNVNNSQGKHIFHESAHLEILYPESFSNPVSYNGSIFSHSKDDDIFDIETAHYNKIIKRDEIANIIKCLHTDPTSKKAYLSLWDNADIFGISGKIPCLVGVYFYIYNEKLFTVMHMRSNELLKLLPVDICFGIALQKYVSTTLKKTVGSYIHQVGSLILYNKDLLELKSI